jgi:uncharacterized protein YbjQ (UPF0145 family)
VLEHLVEHTGKVAVVFRACTAVGVDLDYEVVGSNGSMLMVTCSGTAVKLG